VSGTAAAFAALTAAVALVARAETPVVAVLAQLQSALWVPGFVPLLTLVPLLYPDGLLPGRLWRAAAGASLLGTALMTVGVLLYPEALAGRTTITKPVTWLAGAQSMYVAAVVLLVPSAVVALAGLGVRWRRTTGLRRRQVLVLLLAAGLLVVVTAAQGLLPSPADTLSQAVAVALLPVAIGVAVTRHRLYELDVAVCRALVGLSLAACLAGLYVTVFTVVRAATPGESLLAAAAAAGLTGVLVQPLARRLSAGVERLYYGDRADPYAVSARLTARLAAGGLDVSEVPQAVCDTVVEGLRLGGAALTLDGEEAGSPAVAGAGAGVDAEAGPTRQFPLRHRGDVVARLTVLPRRGEATLDPRDAEILATVADQAAPAIAALRLHHQLQHSRESLVLAREGERRRLRRELHDGLGATLAGLRLQLESAAAASHEPAVTGLLDTASSGVAQAVAEVRHVTDTLRPPAVDELGLGRALELLAERFRTPDLQVTADVDDLSGLPAAVEVAAYRIASEALANAARHAGATRVTLTVASHRTGAGGTVVVEVVDDGVGLSEGRASTGLGLRSMRERAEELGGTLETHTDTGGERSGTRVRAVIPLPAASTTGQEEA
jgi:two-component system NarL family sensor kinase